MTSTPARPRAYMYEPDLWPDTAAASRYRRSQDPLLRFVDRIRKLVSELCREAS